MKTGTFNDLQWETILRVAEHRHDFVKEQNLGPGHGSTSRTTEEEFLSHLIGACGECAIAIDANLEWPNPDEDFGRTGDFYRDNVEARATTHPSGHLIKFDSDPEDRLYGLAIVDPTAGTFRVAGYIHGTKIPILGFRPEPHQIHQTNSKPQRWVHQMYLKPYDEALVDKGGH